MSNVILVVEDSPSIRMLFREVLATQGYVVETAEDGVDGLKRLGEVRPDVLITDLNMPRMDGIGLIEAVRAQPEHRSLPILVLSTESSDDKKSRARQAGATDWLTKPVSSETLGAALRRVCP